MFFSVTALFFVMFKTKKARTQIPRRAKIIPMALLTFRQPGYPHGTRGFASPIRIGFALIEVSFFLPATNKPIVAFAY